MTCTKKALLSFDFIDDAQAENIIKTRDSGNLWYDYQTFTIQFNIPQHGWIDIERKVIFPLKQRAKIGRKIDF